MTSIYSSSSSTSSSDLLRISGMATGIDTDSVIESMVSSYQTKIDKADQAQQLLEWKQEAYQDIIQDIKDLQSEFFDSTSSDKNILSPSNFAGFNVTNGDSSVATISAGTGTVAGNYTIEVTTLAKGSGITNTTLSGIKSSDTLESINAALKTNISLELDVNGVSKSITLDNSTGDKTVNDLINAINDQSGGAVKASFSELTGKFSLTTSATGSSNSLTIKTGTTTDLSSVLGDFTLDTAITNGENADVTITPPGETVGINVKDKSTNNFTIDGITYNLVGTGTSTVTVGADNDKVYDKIKDFIDKYNNIVDKIQTKLSQKKNYDYKPLTDTQKEEMTDDQIEKWEAKAKVGILRNDNNLQNMLKSLKSAFTTTVSGVGLSISKYGSDSIGLDTSNDYSKPAHINIVDASKLKEAIATKGEEVLKLFANVSTSTDEDTAYSENGIFTRIKSILEDNVGYTNTTLNSAILTKYANKQDDYSITGAKDTTQFNKQNLLDATAGDGAGSVTLQVGANENQTMVLDFTTAGIDLTDVETNIGALTNADVTDAATATALITTIDTELENVSAGRSLLGAYQNRLEHTVNNLDNASENLQAAESRIRDVDMAKEMMNFSKNNILTQAAQSMLSQANQQPQQVLQLLR